MYSVCSLKSIKEAPICSYLNKKEIDFYKKIPAEKRKDWLAGRYNMKKVISDYFSDNFQKQIEIKEIEILSKKLKKPTYKLPIKSKIKTNICISHCDGLAVSAISENKKNGLVGVDIEKIRNFNFEILKRFLSPKELKYVKKAKLRHRPLLATLFWSLKESYLKALGVGLLYHPKFVEIKINLEKNTCELYDKNKKVHAKIQWRIFKKKYLITKINVCE